MNALLLVVVVGVVLLVAMRKPRRRIVAPTNAERISQYELRVDRVIGRDSEEYLARVARAMPIKTAVLERMRAGESVPRARAVVPVSGVRIRSRVRRIHPRGGSAA